LQNKSKIIDFQVFDTEVFFGKYGELYPKYEKCKSKNLDFQILKDVDHSKIIFMLIPNKQEIERENLHNYQRDLSICNTYRLNFYEVKNKYQGKNSEFVDFYQLYSDNIRYFEQGDTHWNNFGMNLAIKSLIEKIYEIDNISIMNSGNTDEKNIVLNRLALIDLNKEQKQYQIIFEPIEKKHVLIIHDSFFGKDYVEQDYLKKYFDVDFLSWSKFIEMNQSEKKTMFENYDKFVFESSLDIFINERIMLMSG